MNKILNSLVTCTASTNDEDFIVCLSRCCCPCCICYADCLSIELYAKHFQIAVLNHDNLMMCDTGYLCLNF